MKKSKLAGQAPYNIHTDSSQPQLQTLLLINYWAICKFHYSHFTAVRREVQRTQQITSTSPEQGEEPTTQGRSVHHQSGHLDRAVGTNMEQPLTCWRLLTVSGQRDSLTRLHLAEKLDWGTLQVTCPTFHATLDTEKATSDSDWEGRNWVEVVRAKQQSKKNQSACKSSALPVVTESWEEAVEEHVVLTWCFKHCQYCFLSSSFFSSRTYVCIFIIQIK